MFGLNFQKDIYNYICFNLHIIIKLFTYLIESIHNFKIKQFHLSKQNKYFCWNF